MSVKNVIQVFEVALPWTEERITVFAEDLGHAERIYAEWILAHRPSEPACASLIYHYEGFNLEGRPELILARMTGTAGIGYWDTTTRRWLVVRPSDPPSGDLVRPPSLVKYHRVRATDGEELLVFAESFEEAVGYYVVWHLDEYGDVPSGIVINRKSRWQLVLALASLRDDMDAGVAGVARWTADEGWHIVDPEDGTATAVT
ncbi:hypothetical protein [Altererythrobacter sp. Root672]|uniref:hypothetical protein n=1 Tax=Altererythrobacter sp. Root672 TaxID=1736584 RepID=UPI0006FAC644|nr:hypothetical protein [Altererythrobacter sp. Root672]KRA81225.1 hypothetical protein ASD76_11620 [Altererythrobacter sp. Root672]